MPDLQTYLVRPRGPVYCIDLSDMMFHRDTLCGAIRRNHRVPVGDRLHIAERATTLPLPDDTNHDQTPRQNHDGQQDGQEDLHPAILGTAPDHRGSASAMRKYT